MPERCCVLLCADACSVTKVGGRYEYQEVTPTPASVANQVPTVDTVYKAPGYKAGTAYKAGSAMNRICSFKVWINQNEL